MGYGFLFSETPNNLRPSGQEAGLRKLPNTKGTMTSIRHDCSKKER
jgi:hypothetical protein